MPILKTHWIHRLDKVGVNLARIFQHAAAAAVLAMAALTAADVLLRLWRRPLPGTYELVGLLGIVAIAGALADTTLKNAHIAVTFVLERLPSGLRRIVENVLTILSAGFFSLLAWQCGHYAAGLKASGEVTMTLQWPTYPLVVVLAIGSGLAAVVLVLRWAGGLSPNAGPHQR